VRANDWPSRDWLVGWLVGDIGKGDLLCFCFAFDLILFLGI
jgi:hypothetical protein